MGASVTATGRRITKHMMETMGFYLTGDKSHLVKRYAPSEKTKSSFKKDVNIYSSDDAWESFLSLPSVETGVYDMAIYGITNDAIIYGDTDSVAGESIISTSLGQQSIAALFDIADIKWNTGSNEFASFNIPLTSPCLVDNEIEFKKVKTIYRHRVTKARYRITLSSGKSVIVTDDHSIMVMRNGELTEVKASEINRDTDTCVSINVKK